MSAPLMSHRVV